MHVLSSKLYIIYYFVCLSVYERKHLFIDSMLLCLLVCGLCLSHFVFLGIIYRKDFLWKKKYSRMQLLPLASTIHYVAHYNKRFKMFCMTAWIYLSSNITLFCPWEYFNAGMTFEITFVSTGKDLLFLIKKYLWYRLGSWESYFAASCRFLAVKGRYDAENRHRIVSCHVFTLFY
jgi:hypothetical protein